MIRRKVMAVVTVAAAIAAAGTGSAAANARPGRDPGTAIAVAAALAFQHPRNVIFLLGDGMGTQEITAARYYQGVANPLNVDRMPLTGFQTTWSVKPAAAAPYLPDYDPDSAATGSMWATGQKTIDDRVSQGPSAAPNVPGARRKIKAKIVRPVSVRLKSVHALIDIESP